MTHYFSWSYYEARQRFIEAVNTIGGKHESIPTGVEDMSIDLGFIGNLSAKKLFIHTSGIHGVEGYPGSAIQLALLNQPNFNLENICILFVHVVNPYGMCYNRRWNEDNIDLNRNFHDETPNVKPHPLYPKIDSFLNPKNESKVKTFWLPAIKNLSLYGFSTLQQIIAQGQFHNAKGLFYGGQQLAEGSKLLMAKIRHHFPHIKVCMGLDVHTGLGKFNTNTLFLEGLFSVDMHKLLQSELDARIVHVQKGHKQSFEIKGGYIEYLKKIFGNSIHFSMLTQEFGTKPPIQVLKALRKENFYHHYMPKSKQYMQAQKQLIETFCPSDLVWRKHVIENGKNYFEQYLKFLSRF